MKNVAAMLCVVLWAGAARADHLWVPPQGTFRAAFSLTGARWDQFLETGSEPVALPGDITQYEIALYGEYSPLEHLSLDLLLPLVISQRSFVFLQTDPYGQIYGVQAVNGEVRDVDSNVGIGDVVAGANYMFWDRGISLGARTFVKIPGTYDVGAIPNAPGDGQTDVGLALLFGARLPSLRSYIRAGLGYVFRTGEPHDQLEIMIEPGVNITRRFAARLLYQYVEQFGGEDIQYYGLSNYYPAVEEDAHRLGAGLSFKATDLLGFFAFYQQTIAGQNTANTKALTFGIDFTF